MLLSVMLSDLLAILEIIYVERVKDEFLSKGVTKDFPCEFGQLLFVIPILPMEG